MFEDRCLLKEEAISLNKITNVVINHRKAVVAVSVLLMLLGGVLFLAVPVNYNLTDYLPEKANSTIALGKMEEEFTQPMPNLNVMVEDVGIREALDIKEKIKAADYVDEVLWLDDVVNVAEPLEIQDQDEIETYYKDSDALFSVAVEEGKERDAIESIRDAAGTCKISGNASEQAEAQSMAVTEAAKAIVLLLPLMLIILILTSTSWIEPFLYLLAIGAAVLVNLGSNIVLDEISFVTLAVAPILQMAVSLDYAIFLSHSYNEYRKRAEPKLAMKMAIHASGKSISASMLTTLFGFMALLFMNFKIGPDMGISLLKGVLLSFVSVLVFLPALILSCTKWIDKTSHKRILPEFKSAGKWAMKVKAPVFGILLILIVPSLLAQNKNEFFYGTSNVITEGSESYSIEEKFGNTNALVLMVPRGDSTKETMLCSELREEEHITSVVSYAAMVTNKIPVQFLDEDTVSQFYSDKYARIILYTDTQTEGTEAFSLVEKVRKTSDSYYPGEVLTCGQSANLYDMKTYVENDNRKVNLITLLSIYLVLAFTFQSWLIPIPLILTIKCSIWLNMAVPYFMGDSLCYIGYLVVSTVQMGATVDYAILLTDNYLTARRDMGKKAAMIKGTGNTFGSILISAMILALSGVCLSAISSNVIVKALGSMIGRGAILSLGLVVLLLPVLLLMIDAFIPKTTRHADFYNEKTVNPEGKTYVKGEIIHEGE